MCMIRIFYDGRFHYRSKVWRKTGVDLLFSVYVIRKETWYQLFKHRLDSIQLYRSVINTDLVIKYLLQVTKYTYSKIQVVFTRICTELVQGGYYITEVWTANSYKPL